MFVSHVQGLQHCYTHGRPDSALLDETLRLADLYGGTLEEEPVPALFHAMHQHWQQQDEGGGEEAGAMLADGESGLLEELQAHVQSFGADHRVVASGLDEECEREVEREVEQEVEQEVQAPRMKPRPEADWDYAKLFAFTAHPHTPMTASATASLQSGAQALAVSLQQHVRLADPQGEDVSRLGWSRLVWCTANFMHTVLDSSGAPPRSLADYLRPVHHALLFRHDGSLLLLSEREADAIEALARQQQRRRSADSGTSVELVNLSYCRMARADPQAFRRLRLTSDAPRQLSAEALVRARREAVAALTCGSPSSCDLDLRYGWLLCRWLWRWLSR